MKIFYDIPYMKDIMHYVLIPVVIVIAVVGASLFIYSKRVKDHESPHYNFVMDFWSSLIGIIVTGAILAIAVGFSFAMTEKMREYNLVEEKKMLYLLLKYFVVVPFFFVIWYIVKFLKTIYYKPRKEKKIEDIKENKSTKKVPDIQENNENILLTSNLEKDKPVPAQSNQPEEVEKNDSLPPIDETLKEEMKQFHTEDSKKAEEREEVEVISLEDE